MSFASHTLQVRNLLVNRHYTTIHNLLQSNNVRPQWTVAFHCFVRWYWLLALSSWWCWRWPIPGTWADENFDHSWHTSWICPPELNFHREILECMFSTIWSEVLELLFSLTLASGLCLHLQICLQNRNDLFYSFHQSAHTDHTVMGINKFISCLRKFVCNISPLWNLQSLYACK